MFSFSGRTVILAATVSALLMGVQPSAIRADRSGRGGMTVIQLGPRGERGERDQRSQRSQRGQRGQRGHWGRHVTQSWLVFENGNVEAVFNRPSQPTRFYLSRRFQITQIRNYHWNTGRGAPAGTIALRDASGQVYGPWRCTSQPGQGNVADANWICTPGVELPPGAYEVLDSSPETWSCNVANGEQGMTRVEGARTQY